MNLHLRVLWIGFSVLLMPFRLDAATFYVAPNGDDSKTGAMDQPFATMGQAQTAAKAGDTVYFRTGTYVFNSPTAANGVLLNKSGQSGARINYWAYQGEVPVFDFSGMTAQARITGLRVSASWIHLKGIELKGVPQILTTQHESWGIYNTGSNNIYELINTHHHMGPGLFIAQGGNNLVLNCDAHHNYDPKSSTGPGTNADGFGCHIDTGQTGNVFRGCRAWYNTDDGFDLISASEAVIIENSWAWLNGYLPDTMTTAADGNGFKAGGYGVPPTGAPANPPSHTVRFCLSFQNKAAGFYQNHHPVADHFYNNTSFNNRSSNYNLLGLDANVGILKNNLAYKGTAVSNGTGAGVDDAGNSWNLAVTVSDADFVSVSPTGIDGPRKADGSLPDIGFMHLQAGSDLIDKGQNVQLPFNDAAPDLGAFETGPPLGAGGAAGSTGAAGGAGAGGANAGVGGGMATAAGGSSAAGGGDDSGGANGVGSGAGGADGSGTPGNTSSGGSPGATGNAAAEQSGCSCRAAGGGRPAALSALLSLVMIAGWRRRGRFS